jgi:hypothetical protein
MRNWKRWFAGVLAALMCLLCGCHTQPAVSTTAPEQPSTATGPTKAPDTEQSFPPANNVAPVETVDKTLLPEAAYADVLSKTVLPKTVDNPDSLPVLKWVVLGAGISPEDERLFYPFERNYVWSDQAGRDVNRLLEEEGMPFRVQFTIFSLSRWMEVDWFRIPAVCAELESADLVTGAMDRHDMVKYLSTLTKYVDGTGSVDLSGAVAHEYAWLETQVDGEIYAISSGNHTAVGNGWWVREELFTELGFTPEDFQQADIDGLFARIYEKNGQKGFLDGDLHNSLCESSYNGVKTLTPGSMQFVLSNRFQLIGGCYAIDYSGEKPVVVNYLETEAFRTYQQKLFRYAAMRYMVLENQTYLVDYGNTYSAEAYSYQQDGKVWMLPQEQLHYTVYTGTCYATGICKASIKKTLVLELLERIAGDEDFRTRFCYGVEGKDYVVEDGICRALAREDGSYRMDFLTQLAAFTDFSVNDNHVYLPKAEGMTRLETYRQNVDNAQLWLPVEFNWVYMEITLKDINEELRKYLPMFPLVSEGMYDMVLAAVRDAGGDAVKAELQRQLDAWLEANGSTFGK